MAEPATVAEGDIAVSEPEAKEASDATEASGTEVDAAGVALSAVTVTNTTFTTVLVLTKAEEDVGTGDGSKVCVTVAVVTTTTVDMGAGAEGEDTNDDELADAVENIEEASLAVDGDGVELTDVEIDVAEVDGTAAALNGTGVGTTVELGLGGGRPDGYEFWKISF